MAAVTAVVFPARQSCFMAQWIKAKAWRSTGVRWQMAMCCFVWRGRKAIVRSMWVLKATINFIEIRSKAPSDQMS